MDIRHNRGKIAAFANFEGIVCTECNREIIFLKPKNKKKGRRDHDWALSIRLTECISRITIVDCRFCIMGFAVPSFQLNSGLSVRSIPFKLRFD